MTFPNFSNLRTGMRRTPTRNPSVSRQRKASAITLVKNPIMMHGVNPGHRIGLLEQKPPYDFATIQKAYLVDGYLRQAIDKHSEAVLKEGFWFHGNPDQVSYIRKRLEMMGLATGEPWDLIIDSLVRDFAKFGNALLVVVPSPVSQPFASLNLKGLHGQTPIGGYFNLPVDQTIPIYDDNGKLEKWVQTLQGQKRVFDARSVIHFSYCRSAGQLWGAPPTLGAIEDIRALRQMEESIQRLVDKHLNPLIHQEVPDLVGDGQGRQEDVDDAVMIHQQMAPDGYIITPPGHKIQVLGVESKALRAESYLAINKKRVFADLDVNEEIMGESMGGHPTSDEIIAPMLPRTKFYQKLLSVQLTFYIINEILLEGGFDPYTYSEDRVEWVWNEIDIDRKIKEQTHVLNQYTMNAISLDETRSFFGLAPLTPEEEMGLYVNKIQIPQITAVHTIERITLGLDPVHPNSPANRDPSAETSGASDNQDGAGSGDDGEGGGGSVNIKPPSKIKAPPAKLTKVGGQVKNIIRPANQHGVKFSPNAPRAHKMHCFRYEVVLWADRYYDGKAEISEFLHLAESYKIPNHLIEAILEDISRNKSTQGVLAIQSRLWRYQENL
jgi:hypothetical protein